MEVDYLTRPAVLLAQNIAGPPVWTVEGKSGGGHDVDSTAYLQYIQNKALFSADKLECSAALCLTIWTIIQQYEGSFHRKKNKKKMHVLFSNCLHTHTHIHTLIISSDFLGSLNVLAALFQVNPTHKEVLSAVKVQGHKLNKTLPPLCYFSLKLLPLSTVAQRKRIMHCQGLL